MDNVLGRLQVSSRAAAVARGFPEMTASLRC
jgi:hypothetical protein